MAIHTESIPPFRHRSDRDGTSPSLRELACRRCGGWIDQRDDMRWYHADGTLACVDPTTLTSYDADGVAPPGV